jgi:DNA-binding MarR family transcriptional regulator
MPRGMSRQRPSREETIGACTRQVLEIVPQVMRQMRREMRKEAGRGLSVPQLRVLAFLGRCPGASLSAVADLAGVANATASAMIERLVRRRLVVRKADPDERRRVKLALTARGATLLERARGHARASVAGRLEALSDCELSMMARGLELLDRALGLSANGPEHS